MSPLPIRLRPLLLAGALLCAAAATGHVAAQDVDATAMIRGGLQAAQLIDQGKTAELWNGAAPAAQKRVKRDDFVGQVAQARSPLGALLQRSWVALNRQTLANADADMAGQYVSIEYESRFANAPDRAVREMTSFHLDRDGVWRFSGYVLR